MSSSALPRRTTPSALLPRLLGLTLLALLGWLAAVGTQTQSGTDAPARAGLAGM